MTKNLPNLKKVLAALLTIVAVMVGQQAMAQGKTVTYTISYTGTNTLTATPDVAGFDGSTEVITGPAITGSNDNFGLFLHDNLNVIFNLYQSSGNRRMYVSNDGVTFTFAANITTCCSDYYIKHIAMKDHNGTAIMVYDLNAYPPTNFSFDLDVDLDKLGASGAPTTVTEHHVRTANNTTTIKTITITYGTSPRSYNISYTNAVNGQNGVTNNNRTTYSVATPTFNVTAPTRTGYDFDGFTYTDAAHPTATNATLPMSISRGEAATRKAITFNASWTAHTYTLRLHHNDGSNDYTDMAMTYDVAANIQTVTRTGYTFANWSTNPDGTGTTYTEGQSVINLTDVNGAIVDLYAQWTANTYTLRLHHNDGSNDYTDMAMTYDVAANLQTIIRTGYTFANWSTNPDGTGTTYTEGQSVSNLTDVNGAIVDLYAQWTANTYTLRLHHNDGSNDYTDMAMTYDVATNLQTITRTGYTFANWSTNPDGSGTTYTEGQSVSNLTDVNGGIVDLYAQWTVHTYTVHFDANYDNNGIVISGTMEDQTFTYGQGVLNANAFTRTGYTFAGWNTEADGTGTPYTDQQASPNVTPHDGATVTLYAQWNVIPWTGSGTTENDPFVILYPSQLIKLSNDVNGGNQYFDQFFKLGNDIDMNDVAFDGIGSYSFFSGTFNGDGKTVSNVIVNKRNQENVGFFGFVFNGSVKNLILDGVSITGYWYVGALVGYGNYCSIENCLVMNSNVTNYSDSYNIGVICGYYRYPGDATLSGNHYLNCTLTNGNQTYTTNIGVGDLSSSYDIDGARSIHTLTLPEQVSVASATESVTYDEVTYYAATSTVTFNHNDLPDGYMPTYSASAGTVNGNTLTMPDQDVTVTASLVALTYNITYDLAGGSVATANPTNYTVETPDITLNNPTREGYTFAGWTGTDLDEPTMTVTIAQGSTGDRSYTATWTLLVTYIDAYGVEQTLNDYTLLEGSDVYITYGVDNTEAWYVVAHDVTYNGGVSFNGSANLILMDDATLTVRRVSGGSNYLYCNTDLTIYVQSGGTGAIVGENLGLSSSRNMTIHGGHITARAEESNEGIRVSGKLTINGGVVSVTNLRGYGYSIYGDQVVINGGNVTTTNQYSGYGIYGDYDVTINGGLVTANATDGACGIGVKYSSRIIALGWTDVTDRITSDSYYGKVTVATGHAFIDEAGNYYLSTLTDSQVAAISGQTLIPFTDFDTPFAITYETNGGTLPSGYPETYTFAETVTLPIPTKEDYTFLGWYDNADFEGYPVAEITAGTALGAKTFYAYWAPKYTNVTYLDADGQPQTVRATVLYGDVNYTGVYEGGVYTVLGYPLYDLLLFTGDATLILPDGDGLDVAAYKGTTDSGYGLFVEGNLTIYGQEKGNGGFIVGGCDVNGNVNIYGGEVSLYNLTLNADSAINLSWTGMENYIEIYPTQGNVHLLKDFMSYSHDEEWQIVTTVLHAGDPVGIADLCNHYLYPYAETIDVSYIDENGDEQIAHDAQVLWGNETSLQGGTYTFIYPWLEFNHEVTFGGNTTIIVPDNVEIEMRNPDGNDMTVIGDLAIYGQEERSGDLGSYSEDGIHATGDVTVSNFYFSINKICSGGDILIVGGHLLFDNLEANGGNGTITLGYLTEDVKIKSYGYAGTVVIRAGQTMKVNGDSNTYSGTLTSDQVAEITGHTLIPYLTSITLTVEGYGDGDGGWKLIASPLLGSISPTNVENMLTNTYDLYYFDQTGGDNGLEWKNYKAHCNDAVNPFNALVNGQGYLYANSEDVTLTFYGVDYFGNGEVTITNEGDNRLSGWNLIGNPFNATTTIGKDFYRMNDDHDEIIADEGNIVPMEGIFVYTDESEETVTFTPASAKGWSGSKEQVVINLSRPSTGSGTGSTASTIIDRAIVRLGEGETLPKFQIRDNSTKIYIPQNGRDYAIACAEGQNEMPLNFEPSENGTYTLSVNVDNVELGYLHLIDNLTGANVDMLQTPEYVFTAQTTDYESRFKLVFSASANANGDNEAFAFIDASGNIIITADACDASLQVIDMMGRIIVTHGGRIQCVPTSGMTHGVYVLRLINGNDVRTQKIVIE
jgi:uncharacterized repeat protein (TIGR02543 family)